MLSPNFFSLIGIAASLIPGDCQQSCPLAVLAQDLTATAATTLPIQKPNSPTTMEEQFMEKQTNVPDGIPTGSNIANAGVAPGANANHIENRTADRNAVTIEPERGTIQVGADGNLVVPREVLDVNLNDGSEIEPSMISANIIIGDLLPAGSSPTARECCPIPKLSPAYHLEKPDCDIYVGDCREILHQLAEQGVEFDLLAGDPPFNQGEAYDAWNDNMPWDEYVQFTKDWLKCCKSVMSRNASLWVNCPDSIVADVVKYVRDEMHLDLINWCVWTYRFGVWRDSNFINSKAHAPYFARDRATRIWNPDEVLVPSDRASKYDDPRTQAKADNKGMRVPLDVWGNDGEQYWGRVQGNNKERRKIHPNQLPEVYLERVIRACSNEDSLVLDPFLGSGTTCVVARALGRRSVGIEINPEFAASAFERIKAGAVRVHK